MTCNISQSKCCRTLTRTNVNIAHFEKKNHDLSVKGNHFNFFEEGVQLCVLTSVRRPTVVVKRCSVLSHILRRASLVTSSGSGGRCPRCKNFNAIYYPYCTKQSSITRAGLKSIRVQSEQTEGITLANANI